MLEIMAGAAGGKTTRPAFTVIASGNLFPEGVAFTFTVTPSHHTKHHPYHWSLGGTLTASMIDGPSSGTVSFPDNQPKTIRIKTAIDEFKDTEETLTLQLRHQSDGIILGESRRVTIVYSAHPTGQHTQTATGQRPFVVPDGVTEIAAVAIGAGEGADGTPRGSGGRGGACRWRNGIAVTPGETLLLTVGSGGRNHTSPEYRQGEATTLYRGNQLLLKAAGGSDDRSTPINGTDIGGGEGGRGGLGGEYGPGGGGGAGGYTGHGGVGGNALVEARDGTGGGAGGGGYYETPISDSHHATPGGGVGLEGQGLDGKGATMNDPMGGGGGGSRGDNGDWLNAGAYGGGARGQSSNIAFGGVNGAHGALRLIWGPGRRYPNTRTEIL